MKKPASRNLLHSVVFENSTALSDGMGGRSPSWVIEYRCRAEMIYSNGSEMAAAGGIEEVASIKVRVRSTSQSRQLTTAHRMRDVNSGLVFNIRSVDQLTDRMSVWLVVQLGGVA